MSNVKEKDMTTGSPMKLILAFAIPMAFGYLVQQLYSMVDTMIVGRYLGVKALAAVGATGSINFFVIGFAMGICSGFVIPIAQKFGAKDYKALKKFVGNSAVLAAVISIVMTVTVAVLCGNILKWMNTPTDIFTDAYNYIYVIFLGIPATVFYNLLSGYLRSLGDSRTPLYSLLVASGLNIVLDIFCIVVLNMGVAGAAWATVISQGISGILCLVYIVKKFPILHISRSDLKLDNSYVSALMGMGVPMGLQYSITAIGSIMLQTAVNGLGSMAVAAISAGSKISMFLTCPYDALGNTMATYGGQNVGAKKLERVKKGLGACVFAGAVYSVVVLVITILLGKQLALLFISKQDATAALLDNVQLYLTLNAVCYFLLALVIIVRFMIQGMGFSVFAILAGVLEMVARVFVGLILVPNLGYLGACLGNGAAWIAADIFLIPAFFYVYKKLEKIFSKENEALQEK